MITFLDQIGHEPTSFGIRKDTATDTGQVILTYGETVAMVSHAQDYLRRFQPVHFTEATNDPPNR